MSRVKNVLIISNYYFPEMGGAPQRITALANTFNSEGFNVRVICPLPNYPEGRIFKGYRNRLKKTENVECVRVDRLWILPSKSKNPILRIIGMLSFAVSLFIYLPFLKRKDLELVIVQSPPLFVSFSAVWLVKRILRKKVFLNVSDLWPMSAVELGVISNKGRMFKILSRIEKYIYKNATVIMGQSEEIITHVRKFTKVNTFVYRNLPRASERNEALSISSDNKKTVVYAGLLGFAQGIFKICKEVDFERLDLEFHIYGKGMEEDQIVEFLRENPSLPIFFHGSYKPADSPRILKQYGAALVPLANRIYGAVPSKVFELIHLQIPILFSGGGEGSEIVDSRKLGFTCQPGNSQAIEDMLLEFSKCDEQELKEMKINLKKVAKEEFDYENQFKAFTGFINTNY